MPFGPPLQRASREKRLLRAARRLANQDYYRHARGRSGEQAPGRPQAPPCFDRPARCTEGSRKGGAHSMQWLGLAGRAEWQVGDLVARPRRGEPRYKVRKISGISTAALETGGRKRERVERLERAEMSEGQRGNTVSLKRQDAGLGNILHSQTHSRHTKLQGSARRGKDFLLQYSSPHSRKKQKTRKYFQQKGKT